MRANQAPVDDAIVMDGVIKRFDETPVLDGLSLRVPAGTILGIIGPSGSGKTTAIRLLTGVLEPSDGEARIPAASVARPASGSAGSCFAALRSI